MICGCVQRVCRQAEISRHVIGHMTVEYPLSAPFGSPRQRGCSPGDEVLCHCVRLLFAGINSVVLAIAKAVYFEIKPVEVHGMIAHAWVENAPAHRITHLLR